MNLKNLLTLLAAAAVTSMGFGQSATLVSDRTTPAAGVELSLTASASYAGTPSAMGWSVTLPAGWSYVSTGGPDVPAITPQAGATGTLEWAYTDTPGSAARFTFIVKTSGKPGTQQLAAKVLLRADGKQSTVAVTPVAVTITP